MLIEKTIDNHTDGFNRLGITDPILMNEILLDVVRNEIEEDRKKQIKEYEDRFKIPFGLTKKEYTDLSKKTSDKCRDLTQFMREHPDAVFVPIELENYLEKSKKLKKIIKNFKKHNDGEQLNIQKAKEHPITNFLEFKSGKAICLWHDDKNPSMSYNKKTNRVKCFSCNEGGDAIDVYQKLFNVSFADAVRALG